MKRLHVIVVVVVGGGVVAGLIVLRRALRAAPIMPPTSDLTAPPRKSSAPIDRLQHGLKLNGTNLQKDPAATRRLMERLRAEELRQRPEEQRN